MTRQILNAVLAASLALGLAACGDTWKGAKKDTGENLEGAGDAIEDAGRAVKN